MGHAVLPLRLPFPPQHGEHRAPPGVGVQAPRQQVRVRDDVLAAQPRLAGQEADGPLQPLLRDPRRVREPPQHHGDVVLAEAEAAVDRELVLQRGGLQLGEGGEDVDEHGASWLDAGVLDGLDDLPGAAGAQQDDPGLAGDELGQLAGRKAVDVAEHGERPEEGGLGAAAHGERHLAERGDDARVGAEDLAEGGDERGKVGLDAAVEDDGAEGDDPGEERRRDADGAEVVELGLEGPGGVGREDPGERPDGGGDVGVGEPVAAEERDDGVGVAGEVRRGEGEPGRGGGGAGGGGRGEATGGYQVGYDLRVGGGGGGGGGGGEEAERQREEE
ncbi:Os05g0412900 [Oryza sativa Japonica Group]|uniref:Os05g0412900 protein n=2 Tax=Oryza sativa subsp. japonica TaxID=39947 RepID=A0A0P0WMC9_ORYSJ|nr:unknow protein [Oryza sativa Japonica Group]KAB8099431.1 hypothetical protein EE612_029479 [Oryza sativa]BAF17459.1 Os05g0412900 [Oryza sativa Japonica Group]BAS94014.1 Os05g0412900 [Oryza sativa Japonica Group]|eukprot:NP_001055545.1 Os05g0412900 [Oryza sativa Japonica Group]